MDLIDFADKEGYDVYKDSYIWTKLGGTLMGIYVNPGKEGFATVRRSRYVDKSGLISVINETIGKQEKLSCISRPRRFGKSYAAKMLSAYYDRSCDSSELFNGLKISKDSSYKKHLNQYNVLMLDMTGVISEGGLENVVDTIREKVVLELQKYYPESEKESSLSGMLNSVVEYTGRRFVAIIDEWDAVLRDSASTPKIHKEYLEFLRSLFKNSNITDKVFAAAYMTGILPIKKDGSQSAISEFKEYTMFSPGKFAPYTGFLESEVKELCAENNMQFEKMKYWYDGYTVGQSHSVYNPNSVMEAIRLQEFRSYWKMSSAAGSLLSFINMDYDDLGKAAEKLLAGLSIPIEPDDFENDPKILNSAQDVLTLLVHFGYLSYDGERERVRIPNEEIRLEYARAIKRVKYTDTIRRVKASEQLIKDTIDGDDVAVAEQIQKVHNEEFEPRLYNSEQSLRSVLKLAYFSYKDYYVQMEELAGGTGYADIVYLPKKYSDVPALVVELKVLDKKHPENTPEGAIAQIKQRNYPEALKDYGSEILLVGISYDREDSEKKHSCVIESWENNR